MRRGLDILFRGIEQTSNDIADIGNRLHLKLAFGLKLGFYKDNHKNT